MISLFSQIIREHWCLVYKAKHRCKDVPTEVIPQHIEDCINPNDTYPQVMYCRVISTLSYVAEKASYIYHTNYKVREVGKWVAKNIIAEITKDSRKTFNVKLRIAVGMLNNLEKEKVISKDVSLFYYDNIITNCNDLWLDYTFDGELDELPF